MTEKIYICPPEPICLTVTWNWISVKDKLPDFNERVLAYSDGSNRIYIAYRENQSAYNEHWAICEDSDCSCVGLTAPIDYWMPLPELPKDEM